MNTTSSSEAGTDPMREARAYNNSIYLMLAMPYLLVGILSFKIYQICKNRNDNTDQLIGPETATGTVSTRSQSPFPDELSP